MLLAFQQLVLAQHRQPGQRLARGDRGRVHAAQLLGDGRRARDGPRNRPGQGRHQIALALLGRFGAPEVSGRLGGRLSLRGAADNPSGSLRLEATDVALPALASADMPPARVALNGELAARRLRLDLQGEGVSEQPIRAQAELPLVLDLAAGAFEVPADGQIAGNVAGELSLARLADIAYVTDDNPRTEDPDAIITQIVAGMPAGSFQSITDRRAAIRAALAMGRRGDVILLAGKGHEIYQVLGTTRVPFDEKQIVEGLLAGVGGVQ